MTNFIVLLFISLSAVLISVFGALMHIYEPFISKKIKKNVLALTALILCYTALLDLVPLSLVSRAFSVQVFTLLLFLSIIFFVSIEFVRQKLVKIKNFFSNKKPDLPTLAYISSVIFIIFGIAIGVITSSNIGSGILTATALSLVGFLRLMHSGEIFSELKISKSKSIKTIMLSAVILIPSSVVAYLVCSVFPLLRSVFLIFVTGGIVFLGAFAVKQFFALYHFSVTPKTKESTNDQK